MTLLPRSLLWTSLLLASSPARAASLLLGTVISADSRAPLAQVVVTAISPSLPAQQVVSTDPQGQYRLPLLPPGLYTLRFARLTFKTFSRPDIELRLDHTVRVNVELFAEHSAEEPSVAGLGSTGDGGAVSAGARGGQGPSERGATSGAGGLVGEGQASRGVRGVVLPSSLPTQSAAPSRKPLDAPDQALPHLLVTAPDGSLQPLSHAPTSPERTEAPAGQRFFDMSFKGFGVNPTIDTEEERFSTFSVDVDTASYSLTRAYLQRGGLPEEQAVRVEEFVNSFDPGEEADPGAPFRIHVEGFPSPSRKGYHVLRLGLKAREVSRAERKPAHLVFVIDVSGSMNIDHRLGLVKQALRLLLDELDERDRVSIAVYGTTAHTVLEPTRATERQRVLEALEALVPEGSSHAQAGLELGYALAARNPLPGGFTRLILCSDGVAHDGLTDTEGLWLRVREQAARGVSLTTVGFGMGHYNDGLMERLAQVGGGQYAYVDQLAEARRVFVQNLTGTLQVVARDVKLQVEFDRRAVARYRLVGYENRMLSKEQFAEDKADAAEVGAGHSVTALYEVRLREPGASLGTLRLRYKAPEGGPSRLLEQKLPTTVLKASSAEAAPSTRLAYVAAAFAEKLRGSYWVRSLSYAQLSSLWEGIGPPLGARPDVVELGALIHQARTLDHRADRFERLSPVSAMDSDLAPALLHPADGSR